MTANAADLQRPYMHRGQSRHHKARHFKIMETSDPVPVGNRDPKRTAFENRAHGKNVTGGEYRFGFGTHFEDFPEGFLAGFGADGAYVVDDLDRKRRKTGVPHCAR
jgi:hypothetical protein